MNHLGARAPIQYPWTPHLLEGKIRGVVYLEIRSGDIFQNSGVLCLLIVD